MARQARIQSPTGYYHVMMRGNNKENIFLKNNHKKYFLDCLKEQYEKKLIDIAAYCIMDNHVHIVVKSEPLVNLSAAIKKINTKYAMGYNYRHHRTGHVFQSRYKSEVIFHDTYLLNVIRYVHNNPVKAGIVEEPSNYKWSSFDDYIRFNTIISNVQKQFILKFYNSIEQFMEFHKEADSHEYLDMEEDIKEYRMQTAQKIVFTYLKSCQIKDIRELKTSHRHMERIVKILLDRSKLSHRKIAQLLNISSAMVHVINLKNG